MVWSLLLSLLFISCHLLFTQCVSAEHRVLYSLVNKYWPEWQPEFSPFQLDKKIAFIRIKTNLAETNHWISALPAKVAPSFRFLEAEQSLETHQSMVSDLWSLILLSVVMLVYLYIFRDTLVASSQKPVEVRNLKSLLTSEFMWAISLRGGRRFWIDELDLQALLQCRRFFKILIYLS